MDKSAPAEFSGKEGGAHKTGLQSACHLQLFMKAAAACHGIRRQAEAEGEKKPRLGITYAASPGSKVVMAEGGKKKRSLFFIKSPVPFLSQDTGRSGYQVQGIHKVDVGNKALVGAPKALIVSFRGMVQGQPVSVMEVVSPAPLFPFHREYVVDPGLHASVAVLKDRGVAVEGIEIPGNDAGAVSPD